MKTLFLITGILLTLLIETTALATWNSQIQLQGKGLISCYYSKSTAFLNLTYINKDISWGSKVYLVYGFGGNTWKYKDGVAYEDHFDWDFQNEQEISAISPYTWTTSLEQTLNYRSGKYFLDSIQFVFRIHQPDGSDIYDRGNLTHFGYFNAAIFLPNICPNGNSAYDYPTQSLEVTTVERN